MATGNILSICNRSLLSIGSQSQIASFNEGSAEANACSVLFQPTYESLARSAPWGCLRNQETLTLLAAAQGTPENPDGATLPLPPVPWLYQYAYPPLCLQLRFLVPSLPATGSSPPIFSVNTGSPTWLPSGGQIPYIVAYATDASNNPLNIILTNQSQAIAVYTVNQPNPQIWDSLFQQAMVSSLSAFLAPALSLNLPLMKMQVELADRLITQARVRDGNESPTSMDHVPDFIRARAGASGYTRFGNGQSWNGGWIDVVWPTGT